jgi:DNA-binding NarL/FixJ family response regulator
LARIVIADDHEVVRSGIAALLDGQPGFDVCGMAINGQEAIDRVLELKPDLIILDVTMPILSGFQAARRIRNLVPRVKILVFSMHDAPVVGEVATLMGADAYLPKTVSREKLLSTVKSLLNGHAASAPSRFPFRY